MSPESSLDILGHRLLNAVAVGVQLRLEQRIPGLHLRYTGKVAEDGSIRAKLVGVLPSEDAAPRVAAVLSELRNPAILQNFIK